MTIVAGATPQIAQASCGGNACGALTAIAHYSSVDKRINASVTNRDQAKTIHLKFCINVEGKCGSGFEATLRPHENIAKFAAVNGSAAPQKYAVDVTSAEFIAAATKEIDAKFGSFSYPASAESAVLPLVKKAVESFARAESMDTELDQQFIKLAAISDKIGATDNVESDVRKNNGPSEEAAISAKNATAILKSISTSLTSMRNSAKEATDNLNWDTKALDAVVKQQRADQLMEMARKEREALGVFVKIVNLAVEAASTRGEPAEVGALVIKTTADVMGEFAQVNWVITEANTLQEEAKTLQLEAAEGRFKTAVDRVKSVKDTVDQLKSLLDEFRPNYQRAWLRAERIFNQNTKGRFHFDWVEAALPEVQKTIDLARKTTEAAYTAEQAATALNQLPISVMADPAADKKIIKDLHDTSTGYFNQAVAKRQSAEMLFKRLQDALATARKAI